MVLLDHGGRDAREFDIFAPPADLAAVIEHLWIARRTEKPVSDWRVVPDTSPHVIAMVTARAHTREIRTVVVGARTCAACIDVSERVMTVGLRLRQGALPALTNTSAREFVDRSVSLGQVFSTRVLRDLELGPDAPAPVALQELIRLTRRLYRQGTVTTLPSDSAAVTSVAQLAWLLHTPTRSLRERVHREVGVSPKRMLRLLRLHTALRAARRPHRSWCEIAHATGFADHAHLSREMHALLGEPPSAWAARGSAVLFKTPPVSLR